MKRGQISQIFVWLFMVIVVAGVLIFGFKLIKQGEDLKEDVLIVKFFNDLQKKVDQFYFLDTGSSGEQSFILPGNVEYICFVKNVGIESFPSYVNIKDVEIIQNFKQTNNVFVGPLDLFEKNKANITNLNLVAEPNCMNAGGEVRLQFENLGVRNGVKITET